MILKPETTLEAKKIDEMSPEFQKIIQHIKIAQQKNLESKNIDQEKLENTFINPLI